MKKFIILVIAIAAVSWFILGRSGSAEIITADMKVEGDYVVAENTILKNGVTIEATGTLTIEKGVACDGEALKLVAGEALNVRGTLSCTVGGDDTSSQSVGMALVAPRIVFDKDAEVFSNGHIQLVTNASALLAEDDIERVYNETIQNTGTGPRVGPFVEEGGTVSVTGSRSSALEKEGFVWVNRAHAQEPTDKDGNVVDNVVIGGTWHVGDGALPPTGLQIPTPPKKVKNILVNFDFGPGNNVSFVDFHLVGPDGRDGTSDEGSSCNAKGENGEDAFRMRVNAGTLSINNFRLELGNGGAGGAAVTSKDCDPGIAKGGNGGAAGNFKLSADEKISIVSFTIVPGRGGQGGVAEAYGKNGTDGCPGVKGGDARATGGDGGKNKKELAALGAVDGIGNVTVATVEGGEGGDATAIPGTGGNGNACKCGGGKGGNGTAIGGKGGDASAKIPDGNAQAEGGNGGAAESLGGVGGNGGACPLKPSGGNGGNGGDASSKGGAGGVGTTANGEEGTINDETGGNGGNGGDGCGPGKGGKGGKGNPVGTAGADGKLICPDTEKKTEIQVVPPTQVSPAATPPGTTPSPASNQKKIKVILYSGSHLPVDQLIVEDEVGCGADHWHAAQGVVKSTEGTFVSDPGPQCGYGKVKDNPAFDFSVTL